MPEPIGPPRPEVSELVVAPPPAGTGGFGCGSAIESAVAAGRAL